MGRAVVAAVAVAGCLASTRGFVVPGTGARLPRSTLRMADQISHIPVWERSGRGQLLEVPDGELIAYDAFFGSRDPAVVYLPAFDSPMHDIKSNFIKKYCSDHDHTFITLDYYGRGDSTGEFEEGTVSRWRDDCEHAIRTLLPNKGCVLVGGGIGGWLASLIASGSPELVGAMIGLAADPDFTENLLWRYLPEDKKAEIMSEGVATITWGMSTYPVSKVLIEDARENLVLGVDNGVKCWCPVRLIHGLNDEEVPYTVSLDLARALAAQDVTLQLIKTGNHHLDGDYIITHIMDALRDCCLGYENPMFKNFPGRDPPRVPLPEVDPNDYEPPGPLPPPRAKGAPPKAYATGP